MKVGIDLDRCQGHGRCYALAPELFEPDDLGISRPRTNAPIDAALERDARVAAANCPERAVLIEEAERA
jgi:ferredoxin